MTWIPFFVTPATAGIVEPAQGSLITQSSITVRWNLDTTAKAYYLGAGTSQTAISHSPWGDISIQATQTRTSLTVYNIPLNGKNVYFRLWTATSTGIKFKDYSYSTTVGTQDSPAELLTPLPPENLASGTTITWDQGHNASNYLLTIGSTPEVLSGPPWADIYSYFGTATQTTLENLPEDGSTIYIRLWSKILDRWSFNEYTYQTNQVTPDAIQSPTPTTVINKSSVTFSWDNGSGATEYSLALANSQEMLTAAPWADIYYHTGTEQSVTTPPVIPLDGGVIYARLWSKINNKWHFTDSSYQTTIANPAQIITPVTTTLLDRKNQLFEWSTGTDVTEYILAIASNKEILDTDNLGDIFVVNGQETSAQIENIPLTGNDVYVRLWSKINEEWSFTDYQYFTSEIIPAEIITPLPLSTLAHHAKRFEWTTGKDVTQYALSVATDPLLLTDASHGDIFAYAGTTTEAVATALPLTGEDIYVRLWSEINNEWFFQDYTYPTTVVTTPADEMQECVERRWEQLSVQVDDHKRDILMRTPATTWPMGAIILLHGGKGSYSNWCADSELTHFMIDFTDMAVEQGFAVFALDSTDDAWTDAYGYSCGKRFDALSPTETNIDLPAISKLLSSTIPSLRPPGSNDKLFITGISNGGFLTTRAATHFDDQITAFAPVSSGDPYGTIISCENIIDDDATISGYFFDNETGMSLNQEDACLATQYPNEEPWETNLPAEQPPFVQLHHALDGFINISCMEKTNILLQEHGYTDSGLYISTNSDIPADGQHFWLEEYNQIILDFFISMAVQ